MSEDLRDRIDDARDIAKAAASNGELIAERLDTHLTNCERRYGESERRYNTLVADIKDGFKDQSESTRRLHGRIDKLLWGVLAALAAILVEIVLSKTGLI